jgi:Protein of unknown function (DUF3500)
MKSNPMKSKQTLWLSSIALTAVIAVACVAQTQTASGGSGNVTSGPSVKTSADATTLKAVAAANAFLETLDATQRGKVLFNFDDATQKTKWSNFPTGIFQRNGLKLGELSSTQQAALFTMLGSVLSARGLQQISEVIDGDEVLKTSGGGNLIFGRAEYYVSFLGVPSSTNAWILQFGGHHMAINATVAGANIALTPSLTGGQPTSYTLNGKTAQPIIAEVEAGFKLVNALDAAQQKKAILRSNFIDLVLGPGQDGKTLQSEGLPAAEMTEAQKTLLLELISTRVGILNDDDTATEMTAIKANLEKTYFAWAGPTATGSAAYFRVTGPTILIEYSPQSMGGNASNHVHSMLRDPTNDYGAAIIK